MGFIDKNRRLVQRYTLFFLLFSGVVITSIFPAFADTGAVQGRFLYIIGQVRLFATYGAIISIAVNGVLLLVGGDKVADKAKTGMIYTIIALAAMYMIPAFLSMGKSFFGSGWDPYNPGV